MDIVAKVKKIEGEIIELRRFFHAYPEESGGEFKTCEKIITELKAAGIENVRTASQTGVIADLRVADGLPLIALRSDMDALPLMERTNLEFASQNKGVMHACGHDAHMAMLLGAARVLAENRKHLKKNVRFIFQPAEEIPPGGAVEMIKEGALDGVSDIVALHAYPSLRTGTFAAREGVSMAAADRMQITLKGAGGHAALPQETSDLLFTAARMLTSLEAIPCRRINPTEPAVLSFCSLHAGTAYNILPEKVIIQGTLRTISEEASIKIKRLVEEIIAGVCTPVGATYEVLYIDTYPVTVNNPFLTRRAGDVIEQLFGPEPGLMSHDIRMGAEDFSYYARQIPGVLLFLGTSGAQPGSDAPLHSSEFTIDESAMVNGTSLFVGMALQD